MEAEWHVQHGDTVAWNRPDLQRYTDLIITEPEGIPFLELPAPNRFLTQAFDPKYQNNGNFKYRPGTYILSASGCWHGQCSFCVEKKEKWQVREVSAVIDEIEHCTKLGFREIFDDSATFPTGEWLTEFVRRLRWQFVQFSCNMRMVDLDYGMLKHAGFRMLLFGLESANQKTLDKINKGVKVEDYKYIVKAAKAGLEPHIAVMFGYPWESDEDAVNTLSIVWWLLKKGYAKTAQSSFYTTPDDQANHSHKRYVKAIYKVARSPEFWFNKIRDIHNAEDLKYLWRGIKEGLGIRKDIK